MKLLKYKVHKFRSVKGTDWIEIDELACFVGVNESGKTNLLLPLWKFNPADKATEIDLLLDYPRDEYSELDDEASGRENEHFIEVVFELDNSDIDDIESAYQTSVSEKKAEDTQGDEEAGATSSTEIKPFGITKQLLIKKDYKERFYVYLIDEKGEPKSNDIENDIGEKAFAKICDLIPRFVYYSEYGNLDSDLYLPHVKDNLARIKDLTGKERMKARTLKILFSHLKLDPDEILSLGVENSPNNPAQKTKEQIESESRNKQERYAKLDSAGTGLTKQFREWWSQGNYIFNFNADGYYFRIFVSDDERPEKIELESRSKGLQWFFSFFLVFLAERKDAHKNCVLLLDEPGLSLHPNAQTDLIRFFYQLSDTNQLIYTTHLPFLVDHNNLDKVKAVYTINGLTKISNDLSKADKDRKAIQPVNAAIGISASQSLLVGCDIVIVEGVSDQFYLTMIKNHLVAKNKFAPKREMVFIPVGGVKGVKPVVSILQGSQSTLPFALFDSDTAGKQAQMSLKKGFYSSDKDKVLETDTYNGKTGSEIEDLIPLGLLVDCFDRLFRTEDGLDESVIDASNPIVPQLEQFAKENQLDLENQLGWKVELSKRVKRKFTGDIAGEVEKSWIELFEALRTD